MCLDVGASPADAGALLQTDGHIDGYDSRCGIEREKFRECPHERGSCMARIVERTDDSDPSTRASVHACNPLAHSIRGQRPPLR